MSLSDVQAAEFGALKAIPRYDRSVRCTRILLTSNMLMCCS